MCAVWPWQQTTHVVWLLFFKFWNRSERQVKQYGVALLSGRHTVKNSFEHLTHAFCLYLTSFNWIFHCSWVRQRLTCAPHRCAFNSFNFLLSPFFLSLSLSVSLAIILILSFFFPFPCFFFQTQQNLFPYDLMSIFIFKIYIFIKIMLLSFCLSFYVFYLPFYLQAWIWLSFL